MTDRHLSPVHADHSLDATLPGDGTPGAAEFAATAALLRALAAPARVAIVLSLKQRAMCVHELVDALHLNQPQVSQHLRVLKNSGVVEGHRRGREVEYALVDDHLAHIVTDALIHTTEGHADSHAAHLDDDAPLTDGTHS